MDTFDANTDAAHARVIWIITDGRRGHERQSEGLAQALSDMMPVTVHRIPRLSPYTALLALLLKRLAPGAGLPEPDLILGTGHASHLTLLAAQHAHGGKTVVLMKPSLPLRWFDLCLIPEHDGVDEQPGVILTKGALNPVRPGKEKTPGTGLILVGGPSDHFIWDEQSILKQIMQLSSRIDGTRWTLTTSPRTPKNFLPALRLVAKSGLEIVPFSEVDHLWLPARLAGAEQAWVTPDSVTMVYESLTAGARVGVFDLESIQASQVPQAITKLIQDHHIQSFKEWQQGQPFVPNAEDFNEAERCARRIRTQWFPEI